MENQTDAIKPPNPFNPGSQVDPSDFVGRAQELESFREKLRQTANGSIAAMAVVGNYGIGKTSFLHKCRTIAEEQNALPIYFSLNELDSLNREMLARALIQRVQEKIREEVILQRLSKTILDILQRIRVKTDTGLEVGLSDSSEKTFPNLQSALIEAWHALKGSKIAIVFLIDEAQALEKKRAELLLYLRAVLEQLQITRTPVMFIPAGKLSITGPSGTGFSPLVRTFPPAILVNFNKMESRSFIDRKLKQINMTISDEAFDHVYAVTEGHPFVLVAYLQAAYTKLQIGETTLTKSHFVATDVEFVTRVLAHFFSRFYDDIRGLSKNILSLMANKSMGEATLSELSTNLNREMNELSPNLAKLVQDGAIVRIDRGKYKLFHHLLTLYIQEKMNGERGSI